MRYRFKRLNTRVRGLSVLFMLLIASFAGTSVATMDTGALALSPQAEEINSPDPAIADYAAADKLTEAEAESRLRSMTIFEHLLATAETKFADRFVSGGILRTPIFGARSYSLGVKQSQNSSPSRRKQNTTRTSSSRMQ